MNQQEIQADREHREAKKYTILGIGAGLIIGAIIALMALASSISRQ